MQKQLLPIQLIAQMCPAMFDQIVALGKGTVTHVAFVRLLARVDTIVTLQVVFTCEPVNKQAIYLSHSIISACRS